MNPVPLYFLWSYTDVDRAFWREHLEDWLPPRIFDAHTHVTDPALRIEEMTEQKRRQYWVNEVSEPIDAASADRCHRTVLPGRELTCLTMGHPGLDYDIEGANAYLRAEARRRPWHVLSLLRPQWSVARVAEELSRPGVIGVKPYYALIGPSRETRDAYLEAGIFDFLPHPVLELLNQRRAWVTLHVPKAERLGHPDNLRQVREIRRRYPDIVLVIAHLGRCYTEPHALEALPALADDPGLYFDNSAVLNPAVHRIALQRLGPRRILYGTDNPVFYMRGRRTWQGRTYVNHTSGEFFFNRGRHEPPEVEATYTLMMYEALRAIRQACEELALGTPDVQAVFYDNAGRLLRSVLDAKAGWK